ncbi:MAG: pyridoxal-phosphate dependent enzyme [Desulfurococcaceae archaeon]
MLLRWICSTCGFSDHAFKAYYWKCPRCGNPLSVDYEITGEVLSSRNIWERYRGFVPFKPEKTRGEGLTPLVEEVQSSHRLLFKLEYLNPGGSFKDRGTSLAIYYGYKMGFKKAVVDTSGNTGISVALFSKLYGLEPIIVMPKQAPEGKKKAVKRLGGVLVEAEGRVGATTAVNEFVKSEDVYYVAHLWNPLYIVGHATIAYEVYEEHGVPDYVIAPIGSGGLILSLIHGFRTLKSAGLSKRTPVFIGVQGYSCQTVYEAMYGEHVEGEESTLADGIMVVNPPRTSEIVRNLRDTGGKIVLVGNSDIAKAHDTLWSMGFTVEPTSATVYAAYEKIKHEIPRNSSVLLVLTGSGLKTL